MTNRRVALAERAEQVLVGGVSSGWNKFALYGATHFASASGAHLVDVEGKRWLDFCMGWGSLLLGHNPPVIQEALAKALEIGFGFQYETEYHVLLAELIAASLPFADKIRFANSGTEATLFATRIARCYTGRKKILKFEGNFHGVNDYLMFAVDSSPRLGERLATGDIEPVPGSAGIPSPIGDLVIPVPYNGTEAFCEAVRRHKDDLAAVIMEPVVLASMVIAPDREFIETVRRVCTEENIVLIFDEVMSGFRLSFGGAQEFLGVQPDLATYGKVLGCGLPIAAVAGRAALMDQLAPLGKGEASGTNTGRVLSTIGAYYALRYLREHPEVYAHIGRLNDMFIRESTNLFHRYGVKGVVAGYGGRICMHFGSENRLRNYREVVDTWNRDFHYKCYQKAYERGLYAFLMPLGVCPEPISLTYAHQQGDIEETLTILETILSEVPYREAKL